MSIDYRTTDRKSQMENRESQGKRDKTGERTAKRDDSSQGKRCDEKYKMYSNKEKERGGELIMKGKLTKYLTHKTQTTKIKQEITKQGKHR